MKPADATGKNRFPVKVSWFQLSSRFVATVVEHDGSTHPLALIAEDRGHVGTGDTIMLEVFIERFYSHRADAFGNQVTDGIIHHRRGHPRRESETVGQIRRNVKLAATDVDLALRRLAERNDSRVESMNQSS